MTATLVSLSSGDTFYVDAGPDQVAAVLATARKLFRFPSGRYVNPYQVAQIQLVREVSSVYILERLED